MNEELLNIFELCWNEIKKGATIEECLQNYPDFADELQPYLESAIVAHSLAVSEVPSEVVNRSRTRLLGHAAKLRADNSFRKSSTRFPLVVFSALMLALVLILGSRELIVVSAESLPGDSLYPIKRAVQDIRVRLAPNRESKHEVETQYRVQRIEEVLDLLAVGRTELVSFDGVVDHIAPTRWVVDGITVMLNENTIVIGDISLGSSIEVEGLTTQSGWIEAHELHLREYEFIGQVESIGFNSWIISNVEFKIVPSTQIYSGSRVGDNVLVLARTRDDGTQYALAIIRLPSYIENPVLSIDDGTSIIAGRNVGEELEFSGKVEYIASSYWVIEGHKVMFSMLTEVKEGIDLGDFVIVHALIGDDGSLIARELELSSGEIGQDQNDDNPEDDNLDDKQGFEDDLEQDTQDDNLEQGDDKSDPNDNSGNDEDESGDNAGEIDGSDDTGESESEDDRSDDESMGDKDEEGSSNDDDTGSGSDDDVSDNINGNDDEIDNDEEPEHTEEPED